MKDSSASPEWLFLVVQLPATPSSARVTLWRRLRSAGAASLSNGAWVLPSSEEHVRLFTQLAGTARAQGGSAVLLRAQALDTAERAAVLTRFQADRAREYDEFAQRGRGFLAEIEKETREQKLTFAELEELEDDLTRLTTWLGKIQARDFYPDQRRKEAAETLEICSAALRVFAAAVYAQADLAEADDAAASNPAR